MLKRRKKAEPDEIKPQADAAPVEPDSESDAEPVTPPVENAHVAPGAQQFDSAPTSPAQFPRFENVQVVAILEENVQGKWHHCKMSDGTTRHVPVELFD